MSLNELKEHCHCEKYRALIVRKNFIKSTNCDTWDDVERRVGNYAKESAWCTLLHQWYTTSLLGLYCQAALTAKTSRSSDCFLVQRYRGYVICADPMMVTAADIKCAENSFQGDNLIALKNAINKNNLIIAGSCHACTKWDLPTEKIELLTFTSRQIQLFECAI